MITLITGKKGAGKTKKLVDLATLATNNSEGNVVVIEKGAKLTYGLTHKTRLINIEQYGIDGAAALYGFLTGICATNYDVTDILVDSTLKICGENLNALSELIQKLNQISESFNTRFVFSVSAESKEISDSLNSICEII